MKTIYQFSEPQIKQVHQLYKTVWWAKDRSLEEVTACIKGSQICIGLLDENHELIAFTRIISDFIYKAIIFDVIVCESQRGNGVGKKIMGLIKNHEQLTKVKHFELYCLPEMEAFYSSFGFSTDVGGIKLMRSVNT
ncbi:GNAT family N-acetyltransferase [Psychromonas sp. Urea-02u-13]|uniref:GNAT family N-acetyltransferase n=1 Tax=Psychromonas sp. Urea-02u-13 TaxID=2058326 RepID=UPI000C340F7A|nr:GNAT family N-acetyltransferase [Psychromonas sp. Urea-02u-13]PKG40504.1 GNAT family N-acetyltransferase [Psychromonas sp. Urea-02u-13]